MGRFDDEAPMEFKITRTPKGGRSFSWGFGDWIGLAILALVACFILIIGISLWQGDTASGALSAIKDFAVGLLHGTRNSN